ncbi:MAG: DUF3078 domain-containing protein [Bacteroidota bacterium]
MKKLSIAVMLVVSTAFAQQDTTKTPDFGWKHSVVAGLTLTQVAFTDWAQGGENALAYTMTLEGKSAQDMEKTTWSNAYKLAFGQTRLGDQGLRKTDDKIDFETILTYKLGVYFNPYAAATFKSQFAKGFKYDGAGNKTPVSKYGQKTKVDGGLESATDVEWKLEENILFKSKLELFAPFKTLDTIVVRNDNSLISKVSKYITVVLNVQFINEPDISPKTQVKEALAIGISYTLL